MFIDVGFKAGLGDVTSELWFVNSLGLCRPPAEVKGPASVRLGTGVYGEGGW